MFNLPGKFLKVFKPFLSRGRWFLLWLCIRVKGRRRAMRLLIFGLLSALSKLPYNGKRGDDEEQD